jgi:hypothetical protein
MQKRTLKCMDSIFYWVCQYFLYTRSVPDLSSTIQLSFMNAYPFASIYRGLDPVIRCVAGEPDRRHAPKSVPRLCHFRRPQNR